MISSFCSCNRGEIDMTSLGEESGGIPSSIRAIIRRLIDPEPPARASL
jgi:hypothetical protein